jgi:hypothetical protein
MTPRQRRELLLQHEAFEEVVAAGTQEPNR